MTGGEASVTTAAASVRVAAVRVAVASDRGFRTPYTTSEAEGPSGNNGGSGGRGGVGSIHGETLDAL